MFFNQPLLSYLILYARPANPMGAHKALKYAIENGADLNKGAQNGASLLAFFIWSHCNQISFISGLLQDRSRGPY